MPAIMPNVISLFRSRDIFQVKRPEVNCRPATYKNPIKNCNVKIVQGKLILPKKLVKQIRHTILGKLVIIQKDKKIYFSFHKNHAFCEKYFMRPKAAG